MTLHYWIINLHYPNKVLTQNSRDLKSVIGKQTLCVVHGTPCKHFAVGRVNFCWSSQAQLFLVPGLAGTMTIFLCPTPCTILWTYTRWGNSTSEKLCHNVEQTLCRGVVYSIIYSGFFLCS
jgi:hypothetical protein